METISKMKDLCTKCENEVICRSIEENGGKLFVDDNGCKDFFDKDEPKTCENCRKYVALQKDHGICCGAGRAYPILKPQKQNNCIVFWGKTKYIDANTMQEAKGVSPVRYAKWVKNEKGDIVCKSCGVKIPMVEMNTLPYGELQYVPFRTTFCYCCGVLMEEWGDVEQSD